MTRQEYLDELRKALQGKMNQGHINGHILYYDNYIMEESRKGKSEQQVIEELGNPRLIAKTLIDTTEKFGNPVDEDFYSSDEAVEDNQKGFHANYSGHRGWELRYGNFRLNSWYGRLLLIAVLIMVIIVVANLVAFLLPLVVPLILILLLLSFVFGNRR